MFIASSQHFFVSEASGPVSNLMARPSLTSVLLSWAPPHNPNGVLLGYQVTYKLRGEDPVTVNTTNLSTNFTIAPLYFGANFSYVSVGAYSDAGQGETEQLVNLATLTKCMSVEPRILLVIIAFASLVNHMCMHTHSFQVQKSCRKAVFSFLWTTKALAIFKILSSECN